MADLLNSGGDRAAPPPSRLYAGVAAGTIPARVLHNAYLPRLLTALKPGITLVDAFVSAFWGVVILGAQATRGPLTAPAARVAR
jgi:hypothetical protein